MAILQSGFMKSGNFWLWNVIEAALQQAKVPRKSFLREQPIYRVSKTWDLAFEGEGTIDFVNITRERQASSSRRCSCGRSTISTITSAGARTCGRTATSWRGASATSARSTRSST
jgi:hypothetical protein